MELNEGFLFKTFLSVGTLLSLAWAFTVWIKERYKERKFKIEIEAKAIIINSEIQSKINVVNADLTELNSEIKDLKRQDLDQQESIMELEKKSEKLDAHLHDLIMLMWRK